MYFFKEESSKKFRIICAEILKLTLTAGDTDTPEKCGPTLWRHSHPFLDSVEIYCLKMEKKEVQIIVAETAPHSYPTHSGDVYLNSEVNSTHS